MPAKILLDTFKSLSDSALVAYVHVYSLKFDIKYQVMSFKREKTKSI